MSPSRYFAAFVFGLPPTLDPVEERGLRRFERILGLIATAVVAVLALSIVVAGADLLAVPIVFLAIVELLVVGIVLVARYVVGAVLVPAGAVAVRLAARTRVAVADDPAVVAMRSARARLAVRLRRLRPLGGWVRRRLDPSAKGLGTTMAGMVALFAGLGLWRIAGWVGDPGSSPVAFDVRFVDMATRLGESSTHRLLSALSAAGRTEPMVATIGLLAVGAWFAGRRRGAIVIVATSAVSSVVVTVLKAVADRARPRFGASVEASASWPSGHSAAALALALGLSYAAWRMGQRRWFVVAATVGLLIGYSRAALTVHWPTDVLAGWLVAVLAVGLVASIDLSEPWRRRFGAGHHSTPPPPGWRWFAWSGVMAGSLAIAVGLFAGSMPRPVAVSITLTEIEASDLPTALSGLDMRSVTLWGRAMEPAGIVVVGDRTHLEAAVVEAGWSLADDLTTARLARTYLHGVVGTPDLAAPVTPSFMGERMQDFAIERPATPGSPSVRARHHARFWQLPIRLSNGCPVWAATASLDDRVEWNVRTMLPNHHIDPAIDVERDLIAAEFVSGGHFVAEEATRILPPTLGTNAAGDPFFTDGMAAMLAQVEPCG